MFEININFFGEEKLLKKKNEDWFIVGDLKMSVVDEKYKFIVSWDLQI